jgi:hypothetical protein
VATDDENGFVSLVGVLTEYVERADAFFPNTIPFSSSKSRWAKTF